MYRTTLTRLMNLRMAVRGQSRWMSENAQSGSKNEKVVLPPEPTTCCQSGCPNCVWIKYAQELAQMYDDGDVIARQKISEHVKDPNLKAFLLTTLGLEDTMTKRT